MLNITALNYLWSGHGYSPHQRQFFLYYIFFFVCFFFIMLFLCFFFFFSSRRRHTRFDCDWSSDVCSSDLATTVNTSSTLPTKEELLALLREEERRRFSPEIQKLYHDVGTDPTSGKDWMDVTDRMQHDLVREFGFSDEAVQLLRRAPQLYPGEGILIAFSNHFF